MIQARRVPMRSYFLGRNIVADCDFDQSLFWG